MTLPMTKADAYSQTTLVLEAGENLDLLVSKLGHVLFGGNSLPAKIYVACPPGLKAKAAKKLSNFQDKVEILEVQSLCTDLLPFLTTSYVAFLPALAPYCPPPLEDLGVLASEKPFLRPWIPPVTLPDTQWARLVYMAFGWISTPSLLQLPLGLQQTLNLRDLERVTRNAKPYIPYLSAPTGSNPAYRENPIEKPPKLSAKSSVMALIPHFQCEEWLGQCLDSLLNQTRPPDAIVVMDDASPDPPLDIVPEFSTVTLLRFPDNVGPYRMVQSVIEATHFDAYMFQDADDWSSMDRLECLLKEAERTGAQWIGTQELMYFEDSVQAIRYPLDLNTTPKNTLHHPFCYPSSLISREFLFSLGGFASGLRFSGDLELLTRAILAGKVANLDRYAYFRRIRKNSLSISDETGIGSLARKEVDFEIEKRKVENSVRISKGLAPLLEPLRVAKPVAFEHLAGPHLPVKPANEKSLPRIC